MKAVSLSVVSCYFSDAGENPDTSSEVCGGDALCISERNSV